MTIPAKEKITGMRKMALCYSLLGKPPTSPDEQRQYITRLLKRWAFPSTAMSSVSFADIVIAYPSYRLVVGLFLFPFRVPYYLAKLPPVVKEPQKEAKKINKKRLYHPINHELLERKQRTPKQHRNIHQPESRTPHVMKKR